MEQQKEEELLKKIDLLTKNVNKLDRLVNLMAKTLHLVPVTEKEERSIQITRRKNEQLRYDINNELDSMQNKTQEYAENLLGNLFETPTAIYDDVLGDDMLTKLYPAKEDDN